VRCGVTASVPTTGSLSPSADWLTAFHNKRPAVVYFPISTFTCLHNFRHYASRGETLLVELIALAWKDLQERNLRTIRIV
jgi:hypothetical protein